MRLLEANRCVEVGLSELRSNIAFYTPCAKYEELEEAHLVTEDTARALEEQNVQLQQDQRELG